jgi:hypothetical protein
MAGLYVKCIGIHINYLANLWMINISWYLFAHKCYNSYIIRVITKLPNIEQSSKGKGKTHKSTNRQNQSITGKLGKAQWPWLGTGILTRRYVHELSIRRLFFVYTTEGRCKNVGAVVVVIIWRCDLQLHLSYITEIQGAVVIVFIWWCDF